MEISRLKKISLSVLIALIGFSNNANAQNIQYMEENEVYEMACEIGARYNISPELLVSIAFQESSFDPNAVNGDCTGLMQVSNKWHGERASELGVGNLYDPYGNMLVAADYLHELFVEHIDVCLVLDIYNGNRMAEQNFQNGVISEYAGKILERSHEMEEKNECCK